MESKEKKIESREKKMNDEEKKIIGERLKKLRKQQDLTQERISELLNLSTSAYCKYEYGQTTLTYDRIKEFSQILKLTPNEFVKCLEEETCTYSKREYKETESNFNKTNPSMEDIHTHKNESDKKTNESVSFNNSNINGIGVFNAAENTNMTFIFGSKQEQDINTSS